MTVVCSVASECQALCQGWYIQSPFSLIAILLYSSISQLVFHYLPLPRRIFRFLPNCHHCHEINVIGNICLFAACISTLHKHTQRTIFVSLQEVMSYSPNEDAQLISIISIL